MVSTLDIQELIQIGITRYESFVVDGHAVFYGKDGFEIKEEGKYEALSIAGTSNALQFKSDLKKHQQGETDYLTFCKISADLGIEKWVVDMAAMSCTYYDKAGKTILTEKIPTVTN